MWSPDFGDYWANINPRLAVQDMDAESSTVLYILDVTGLVQKMPYTGTAWSSAIGNVDTALGGGHTIRALAEGHVLVGANAAASAAAYPVAYSANGAEWFYVVLERLPTVGNVHVIFDAKFKDNSIIYAADDGGPALNLGSIYRNTVPSYTQWIDLFGAGAAFAPGIAHQSYYGLAMATEGTIYGAHDFSILPAYVSAVERNLYPTLGIPKPGHWWDCLAVGLDAGVVFTAEPRSLKICGCLTPDTDSTLYALDNRLYAPAVPTGRLYAFTDCMAKRGPVLTMDDKTLIGCDPVSGRNQEVNLTWEQLCLADQYRLEVAKDLGFTQRVIDTGPFAIALAGSVAMSPNFIIPPGGAAPVGWYTIAPPAGAFGRLDRPWIPLECGHTYYWRVRANRCATTQIIWSPYSEKRSFTIKAGFPVSTPYYGVQLLAPDNGCIGCPTAPASFSWSPFKETTKYKFVLAKDGEMKDVVVEAEVTGTAYEYDGTLANSTNYFWRVMGLEPAPSDWSATFSFQTEAAPEPAPEPEPAPPTPLWVWVVIGLGAILVIVTLVLIFKTRRV
jgi:hypothetical protein